MRLLGVLLELIGVILFVVQAFIGDTDWKLYALFLFGVGLSLQISWLFSTVDRLLRERV